MLDALASYVPLFQTLVWAIVILAMVLLLKKQIRALLDTFVNRLEAGSSLEIGSVKLLAEPFVTETNDLKQQINREEVKIFGNPDKLVLLFKAEGSNWSKSTKAMQVPGGCILQVSTERKGANNTWAVAEALTFIPGAVINGTQSDNYSLDLAI